ncbi:MAG: SAM-dependent methyltransferase [Myxococcota bacterium]|jgi:SAM-dependent methyltransferase
MGTDQLRDRYEQLPYPGGTYRFTHPDRLAVTARLRGLETPPVETARILEIGCGTGVNAVAMAAWLPQAQVVGIDLSADILKTGLEAAAALGLDNIRLLPGAIEAIPKDIGAFDYIIAHGVFSWVPGDVQDALLANIADFLSPDGLAYVSYNTAPGWHLQNYVRDLMLRMAPREDPTEACSAGRTVLQIAAGMDPESGPHVAVLAAAAHELSQQPDGYLFHDYLTPINTPIYFQDFVAWASQHDLNWVGEARPGEHRRFGLAEGPQRLVDATTDEIVREELLDFLRARRFRRSVLTRGRPPLDVLPEDGLAGLHAVIRAVPVGPISLLPDVPVSFTTRDDLDIGVGDRALKTALALLWERHPTPVAWETIRDHVTSECEQAPANLASALTEMFKLEVIDLLPRTIDVPTDAGDRPTAAPFARHLAEAGETWVLNAFHERGQLGPLERELIRLCDGTRSYDGLVDGLLAAVQEGRLVAHLGDDTVDDLAAIRDALVKMVSPGIDELVSLGLLSSE